MGPLEKLEALRTRTPGDFAGRGCLGTDAFSLPLTPGLPGLPLCTTPSLLIAFFHVRAIQGPSS